MIITARVNNPQLAHIFGMGSERQMEHKNSKLLRFDFLLQATFAVLGIHQISLLRIIP